MPGEPLGAKQIQAELMRRIMPQVEAAKPRVKELEADVVEIKAQGVDEFADHMQSEKPFWEPEDWAMMDLAAEQAYKFADSLRAGRKG